MATGKTETGVSWEVAFDFDCEPNLSSAFRRENFVDDARLEYESGQLVHDTFWLALLWQRRLLRLAVGGGAVSSMAAVRPGQPGHQRPSGIL